MKAGTAGRCLGGKTRPERLRSSSSDSGCDVQCETLDLHDSPREVTLKYCEGRLQEVIKINLRQSYQQTQDCKTSLKSEDDGAWRRQLASVLELTANQVYWETKELKEILLYGTDQPPWQEASFVIQELEESQSDWSSCSNPDTDSITSWGTCDRSGVAWPEWNLDEQSNRQKRWQTVRDFDFREIFWKICLENNNNTYSFLEEMHNLPSWDSPDIFLDSEDDSEDNLTDRDDSLEIFQAMAHIFDEPQDKSWNEEQKFGDNWDYHLKYYEVGEREGLSRGKEWSQAELMELVDSLDTISLIEEPPVQDRETEVDQQAFRWTEAAKFGTSWEGHLREYGGSQEEMQEIPYIWSRDRILQTIHRLQPIDFNQTFLKDLSLHDDSEEIFEDYRGIFEDESYEAEPCWSEEHRFGESWESYLGEYEDQDRNIHWNFRHKFGSSWTEELAKVEEAAVKQLRRQVRQRRRRIVVDILDIFWNIALDRRTNIIEPKLQQILGNLPVSDSPDIFTDSSLMFYDPTVPKNYVSQEEILDIFSTGKTIFKTIDNHDEEISIYTEGEDSNNNQKYKKSNIALGTIRTFFKRVKFTGKRKPYKGENFEKKKKVWWKKIRF